MYDILSDDLIKKVIKMDEDIKSADARLNELQSDENPKKYHKL
jgi:hypothetical protein